MSEDSNEKGLITGAMDLARDNVASIGRALETVLRLPGLGRTTGPAQQSRVGAPPGIEHHPEIDVRPQASEARVQVIQYAADRVEELSVDLEQLEEWLETPTDEWVKVRWINVDGLHPWIVERFRTQLGFHTLAAEDVLHVPQRPGVEPYKGHLFVKLRLLMMLEEGLLSEQVSMFVWPGTVLTFQERPGDVWEPVRRRIRRPGSRLRASGSTFLMYALLDAAVDHCFPLLERYSDFLEDLEERVLEDPQPQILQRVQHIRRELVAIRRVLWPTREMLDALMRDESGMVTERTQTFLRDVYTHAVQLLDILEAQREMCAGLSDLYMSGMSNRMNEIMKVLTIMASLFIPITFVAGVYGMNFEHIPELGWEWSYPVFWGFCAAIVVGLLIYFRRRGWV